MGQTSSLHILCFDTTALLVLPKSSVYCLNTIKDAPKAFSPHYYFEHTYHLGCPTVVEDDPSNLTLAPEGCRATCEVLTECLLAAFSIDILRLSRENIR